MGQEALHAPVLRTSPNIILTPMGLQQSITRNPIVEGEAGSSTTATWMQGWVPARVCQAYIWSTRWYSDRLNISGPVDVSSTKGSRSTGHVLMSSLLCTRAYTGRGSQT